MAADELLCVRPDDVGRVWHHVRELIVDALHRGDSHLSSGEIYRRLLRDEALLWLCWDKRQIILGALVTEVGILKGTDKKLCTIIAFGAISFKRCVRFFEDIHQYARNEGCERIRLYGRHGWERALRKYGYKPLFALEKVL